MNGVCRFCGQLISINEVDITTEDEAQEYASLNCGCPTAVRYKEQTRMEHRAKDDRAQALNRAEYQIDRLLGAGSSTYGLTPIEDEVLALMNQAASLVYDENIKDITVNIEGCIKLKISKSTKGKIVLMRSDAAVFKQEA